MAVSNAGGTGYVSAVYAGLILLLYIGILLQVLKVYPNKNIYDVLKELVGVWIAKAIILMYALWAYFVVLVKVGAYTVTLQATLMPSIHPGILLVILFLLVLYTLSKNERTIFRFAEFLYQPVIFFLAILFLFAVPNMNYKQLIPVSVVSLRDNLATVPMLCAMGGNIVIVLFFCKHLVFSGEYRMIRRKLYQTVGMFALISAVSIVLSVGMNGVETTSRLSYPIFQAIKGVSILNSFERFDSFMTMIDIMSDFVAIIVFLQVTMLCLGWVFNYHREEKSPMLSSSDGQTMNNSLKVYGVVLFFIACVYILLRNVTQYEFESFYRSVLIYLNLVFQYAIPVLLGLYCWVRQKIGRNQSMQEQ